MIRSTPVPGICPSLTRLALCAVSLSLMLGAPALGKAVAPSVSLAASTSLAPSLEKQGAVAAASRSKQADITTVSPAVPALPTTIPDAVVPPNSGIVGLTPGPTDDLGLGLLHPQNLSFLDNTAGEDSPLAYGRWLRSVALPLYTSPDGDLWGWMINGWLMIDGYEPIAIGQDASFSMVEARPGLYSFPVLEQQADGWFRFQYTPAGSAWAHIDHLNVGSSPLAVQPWEAVLPSAEQIRFRRHGLSQALRLAPSPSAALQSLVVPNSRIRPLAIEGDWMRVEVIQPVQGCTTLPGHTTEEGWLRWRDDNQSLLVWTINTDCAAPVAE